MGQTRLIEMEGEEERTKAVALEFDPQPFGVKAITLDQRASYRCTTAIDYERGVSFVKQQKSLLGRLTAHYKALKDPINRLRGKILGLENSDTALVKRRIEIVDGACRAWRAEQLRRETELARIARDEARALAETEKAQQVEALKKQAQRAPDPILKQAIRQEAAQLAATPAVPVMPEMLSVVPAVAGYVVTQTHEAVVDDLMALVKAVAAGDVPLSALQANQVWLNGQARQFAELLGYPGVTVVKVEGSRASRD